MNFSPGWPNHGVMLLQWLAKFRRRRAVPGVHVRRRSPDPQPDDSETTALPSDDNALVTLLGLPAHEALDPAAVMMVAELIREEARNDLTLPAFPTSAARVFEQVERTDVDLNELVRTLHWEPAVVSELLTAANAAAYQREIDDLRTAVMTLGMRQVAAIAAGVVASSLVDAGSRAEYELYPELWYGAHRDGMVLAITSSWLANAKHMPRYDRVFLRGMLWGTGRKLALRALARPLADGRSPFQPVPAVITAAIDEVQRDIAASALAAWPLPASVSLALDPANRPEQAIVDLVSTMLHLKREPSHPDAARRVRELAKELKLGQHWLRVTLRECTDALDRVTALLPPPTRRPKLPNRLGSRA